MATTREILEFLIDANVQGFVSGMDKAGAAAERELGKTDSRLDAIAGKMTTWGAATFGAASVAALGLGKLATMAGESEVAQAKLDNSIANSTQSFIDNGKALNDLADDLMGSTVVDDEAVKGVEALLVQFGYTEDTVLRLTPLVVDLSRKMGIDLETAAKAVGRSAGGSETALKRLGINVEALGVGANDTERTISALQQTVGGFAAEEAQTFAGQLQIMRNQLSEIGEQVGVGAASTLGGIVGAITGVADAANDMNPGLSAAVGSLGTISAIGAGGLGALSFAAGSFLQMRDNLTGLFDKLRDAEGRLTRFGQAAAGLGSIAIGAAVVGALVEIGNSFNKGSQDIRQFREDLLVLQGAAEGDQLASFASSINANIGTLDGASIELDRLNKAASGSNDTLARLNGIGRGLQNPLLLMQELFGSNSDLIAQFGEGANATAIDLNQLDETIDKIAESGSIGALEAALRGIDQIKITNPEQQQAVDDARANAQAQIDALKNGAGAQRNLDLETRKAAEAARDQALAAGQSADGLVQVTATAEDLKDQASELAIELQNVTAEFDIGQAAAKGFGKGYEVTTGNLQGIIDSAQGLGEAFKAFNDQTDSEGATVAAVLSALPTEGFDPVTASLGGYTDAQNKAIDALQGWGDAVNNNLQAQIAAGAANEEVLNQASNYESFLRNYLIDTLGVTEEAAQRYIETLGLTPSQVETQLKISGAEEARSILGFLQADFDSLPAEKRSEINALVMQNDWEGALQLYREFQDKQVRISIAADLVQKNIYQNGLLSWFGPRRAIGGPVAPDRSVLVGERGPELFVPNTTGMIVPNNLVQDIAKPTAGSGVSIGTINITEATNARLTAAEMVRVQRDETYLAGV